MALNADAVLVDSSVWIAFFDKDDVHYNKAKALFDLVAPATLLLTDYVVQEIITIFLYRDQKILLDELMITLERPDIEIISVENYFLKQTIRFADEHEYKPKISLTDWLLLFLAKELGFNLLTFDKQLANATKRLR